ncbi:hypothetical protein PENTCL1PPCAC_4714, partial [Pristionchus entomophagus]
KHRMCRLILADLPSDIIRKIIRMEQASLDRMRLVSCRWNSMAVAHLTNRKRLPIIKSFRWKRDYMYSTIGHVYINICLQHKYLNYFGVESWKIKHYPFMLKYDEVIKLATRFTNIGRNDNFVNRLTRFFGRCSRIESLELERVNPIILKTSMKDVIVDKLSIKPFDKGES